MHDSSMMSAEVLHLGAAAPLRPGFTVEATVAWPVRQYASQYGSLRVTVCAPRRLDLLEWVLLAAADAWDGSASIAELGTEMGLGGEVLLRDAAAALVTGGALVAQAEPTGDRVQITDRGRATFERGQVDGLPKTVGLKVAVDALTRLVVPAGRAVKLLEDQNPEAAAEALPAAVPLAAVEPEVLAPGRLEVAAFLARHPQGLARDVEVTQVDASLQPSLAWIPQRLAFALDGEVLRPVLDAPPGSVEALEVGPRVEFVRRQGIRREALEGLARRVSWVEAFPYDPEPLPALRREAPDARVVALANLGNAKDEVVVHPAWAARGEILRALAKAAQRGVRVIVLGEAAKPQLLDAPDAAGRGGRVVWPARLAGAPAALVIDGAHALVVEVRRPLAEWSGRTVPVQRVALCHEAEAAELRRRLLGALTTDLPTEAPPTEVSAAGGDERSPLEAWLAAGMLAAVGAGDAAALVARVQRRTRGVARVEALARLAPLVGSAAEAALREALAAALRAAQVSGDAAARLALLPWLGATAREAEVIEVAHAIEVGRLPRDEALVTGLAAAAACLSGDERALLAEALGAAPPPEADARRAPEAFEAQRQRCLAALRGNLSPKRTADNTPGAPETGDTPAVPAGQKAKNNHQSQKGQK